MLEKGVEKTSSEPFLGVFSFDHWLKEFSTPDDTIKNKANALFLGNTYKRMQLPKGNFGTGYAFFQAVNAQFDITMHARHGQHSESERLHWVFLQNKMTHERLLFFFSYIADGGDSAHNTNEHWRQCMAHMSACFKSVKEKSFDEETTLIACLNQSEKINQHDALALWGIPLAEEKVSMLLQAPAMPIPHETLFEPCQPQADKRVWVKTTAANLLHYCQADVIKALNALHEAGVVLENKADVLTIIYQNFRIQHALMDGKASAGLKSAVQGMVQNENIPANVRLLLATQWSDDQQPLAEVVGGADQDKQKRLLAHILAHWSSFVAQIDATENLNRRTAQWQCVIKLVKQATQDARSLLPQYLTKVLNTPWVVHLFNLPVSGLSKANATKLAKMALVPLNRWMDEVMVLKNAQQEVNIQLFAQAVNVLRWDALKSSNRVKKLLASLVKQHVVKKGDGGGVKMHGQVVAIPQAYFSKLLKGDVVDTIAFHNSWKYIWDNNLHQMLDKDVILQDRFLLTLHTLPECQGLNTMLSSMLQFFCVSSKKDRSYFTSKVGHFKSLDKKEKNDRRGIERIETSLHKVKSKALSIKKIRLHLQKRIVENQNNAMACLKFILGALGDLAGRQVVFLGKMDLFNDFPVARKNLINEVDMEINKLEKGSSNLASLKRVIKSIKQFSNFVSEIAPDCYQRGTGSELYAHEKISKFSSRNGKLITCLEDILALIEDNHNNINELR